MASAWYRVCSWTLRDQLLPAPSPIMVTVLQHGPPLLGSVSTRAFPPQMPGVSSSVETDVLAHYFCPSYCFCGLHLTAHSNHREEFETWCPGHAPEPAKSETRAPFTKEGKCIIHLGTLTSKWPFKSLKAFLSISNHMEKPLLLTEVRELKSHYLQQNVLQVKLSQVSIRCSSGFGGFHQERNVLNNSLEQVISPVSKTPLLTIF